MTKIKKQQHKRLNFPQQEIRHLREALENGPVDTLAGTLQEYSEWRFVRGDMYHWIKVLNRFDEILADVCSKYNLSVPQARAFDSGTQKLLVAILSFSCLLLENCINRNLYSSTDRLDHLLNTSDHAVLECTLRILVRTAQRWSYQRDLKTSMISMSGRLTTIADSWHAKNDIVPFIGSGTPESLASHTNEFRLLAQEKNTELLQSHAGIVHYQFFRTAEEACRLDALRTQQPATTTTTPATTAGQGEPSATELRRKTSGSHRKTPAGKKAAGASGRAASIEAEGLVCIDVPVRDLNIDASLPVVDQMMLVFDRLVERFKVPASCHFELRFRIYVALAMATGDSSLRYSLLRSRIYAATIFTSLLSEQEFKNMFLSREPNYTCDIIGILQPEVNAPLSVQTAALIGLEGVMRQRGEVSGAYAALNASANHGVLMFILRKAFAHAHEPPVFPQDFMNALFNFITGMIGSMNGGQLLVSAGIVPVFVSALKHDHPLQRRGVSRVAKLLDSLITSANSAFAAFCSANGIAVLVQRMHSEVASAVAISDASPDVANDQSCPVELARYPNYPEQIYRRRELLTAEHTLLLKELFKFMSRMLQQTSHQDRLRNLIETTLPQTLVSVLSHPVVFGNNVYGQCVLISATLVHNEPTSLPVIQEANLPQTFLAQLEKHIPYSGDVIQYIPTALGAFCLNEAGMEQFKQSTIIERLLSIFSEPDFARILQEGDIPGTLGSAIDELMRHFPSIKGSIMDQVIIMLKQVVKVGEADSPLRAIDPGNTFLLRSAKEEDVKLYLEDYYAMMLESATTFLEGLLEQRAQGELFMERGGWDLVVRAIRSPLLPFDFVKSRAYRSLNGLSSTLLDTTHEAVFKALFVQLKECLQLPLIVNDVDHAHVDPAGYVALTDPTGLSEEELSVAHTRIHNTISATTVTALITYLINGSGGGSLARSLHASTEFISSDELVWTLGEVCRCYCSSVRKAVAIAHVTATFAESDDEKTAKAGDQDASRMDVDSEKAASSSIVPFVKSNYLSLSETAIAFTIHAADFIECMSNSLNVTVGGPSSQPKLGNQLAHELNDFVNSLLEVCGSAERTVAGAQLIDQTTAVMMKTLVFVRHRIYLKLRIFLQFVESQGLGKFCALLEAMWQWAESLPPVPAPETSKDGVPSPAKADPHAKLRQVLENVLDSLLSILSFMSDGEPLAECPEITALMREHTNQQTWFRPSDVLVHVRTKVLSTLSMLWQSPLLIQGSANIAQSFTACLGPIISAQHEQRTSSSATSSAPGSQLSFRPGMPNYIDRRRLGQTPDGMPALRPPLSTTMAMLSRTIGGIERASPLSQSNIPFMPPHPIQPTPARPHAVVPNPERVGDLMAMGFSREDAEAALRRNLNSLARAANDLLAREAEAEDRGEESAEDNAEESDADANADADAASEAMDDAHEEQRETEPAAEVSESEPMAVDDAAPSAEAAPAAAAEEAAPPAEPSATEEQPALPAPTVEGIAPFNDDGWRSKRVADEDADRELLGELRASIRDSIAPRAIELLGEFGEQAVMRLRGILELVMRKNDSGTIVHILLNAFTPLLSQVTAEGSDETSSLDKQLAAHAHLWAVLVSTPTLLDEMYPQIGKLASHLIRALDVASRRKDRSPVWLTAALLLTEQLIQRDDEPPNTKLETKEDFQRIAKRGLTKLPPSSAPIEPVGTPVAGSSRSPLVRELIAEPLTTSPEESAVVDMAGDHSPAIVPAQSAGGAEPKESTPERQPIFDSASRLELQRLCAQFFTQPMPTYAPPVLNALLRLIVILTRTPEFATRFFLDGHLASVTRAMRTIAPGDLPGIAATVSKDATPLVFVNAIMSVSKEQSRDLRQERTLVMHVLRHTVESRPVLKLLMENLIHGWFESPQFSSTDANAYARGTVAYSLRNPEVFNEVSAERCYLPHYSEDLRVNWMALAWRSEKLIDEDEIDMYEASPLVDNDGTVVEENSATSGQPGADAKAKTVEFEKFLEDKKAQAPFKPYTLDAESERLACSVAEFLASEILTLRPAAIPLPSAVDMQAAAKPVRPTVSPLSGPAVPSTDDCSPDTVAYRCFLIQCLAEMVASFPFTMQAIFVARSGHLLSAPPSRTKDSSKGKMRASAAAAPASTGASADGPVQQSVLRVRSPLISHLVHDLIVREALNSTKGAKMRTRPEDLATMGTEEEQALAIASQQIKVKRSQLSRCVTFWATALLSTICVRHHEGWTTTINASPRAVGTEDITLESLHGSYDAALSAARQLVLDHIVRAFRECLSMRMAGIGGADVVYARLTSLAQLTYKLVIARSINHGVPGSARTAGTNSNGDRNGSERENANALKKMILERGILDLLTAASSRLNLNYPQSREMLNNFLRPIELLSKAAVKISREAVLSAWEQSGQEKMPLNADQRGFAVDLFYDDDVHNNSTTDADDDVPPDLYQNSALGLYQNQRTGGRDLNADYDDELMEEDFDEDMYDEGNSSVSDIDTEDEEMVDNIVLDQSITDEVHNVDGNSDLDMEMDTIMREGEDDEDDDDDEDIDDDDDNGSIDSEDVDEIIDDDIDETAITPGEAISLTLEEDDGALFGSEFDADIADTENEDTDGDESDTHHHHHHHRHHHHHHHMGEDDDGWESSLSEGELEDLAEIHRLMRHQSSHDGHRHRNIGTGGRGRTLGENLMSIVNSSNLEEFEHALEHHGGDEDGVGGHNAADAAPFLADPLQIDPMADIGAGGNDDGGSSSSGSSGDSNDDEDGDEDEDEDSFLDELPETFEITMETLDGQPLPSDMTHNTDFTNFLTRAVRGHLAGNRDLANDPIEGMMQLGSNMSALSRSLGNLGAAVGESLEAGGIFAPHGSSLLDMPFPRLTSLGRANHAGGALGGSSGHNMAHPMIDSSERTDRIAGADRGLQARADRITRNTMGGPLRTAPDDVYNLGQRLSIQFSQMLSNGRRPVHTDVRILGPSNQQAPSALAEGEPSASKDDTVINALGDTDSRLVCALHELMHLSRAVAAIEGYTPQSTVERWQEEGRMLLSGPISGLTPRIMNALLNKLIPEAIQQNLLRRRYQIEIARRDNIIDRRRMEREDADRKRREEEARAAEELRLQQEEAKRAEEEAEHEREMIAREELPSRSADAMSLDEPSEQEGSGQVAEEQPQQQAETPSEPVFVTVNGQRVDITDTGIDPEFLLALPDDLRMEVINDRRAEMSAESRNNSTGGAAAGGASAGAGAVDSEENDGISQEFLDALPPEIREEVLSQQRLQRQLYERDELMRQRMARTSLTTGDGASAQPGGSSSGATPSSQHPATAAALARVGLTASSRGSRLRAAHLDLPAGLGRSGHASGNQTESAGEEQRVRERRRKKIGSRDITVQLLGKPELAVLTRFIFLPNHGLSNTLIMKVMQYLCENGSTRAHFIQLMLSILSGCALTLADVDKVIQTAIASSPESGAADASGSRPLPRTGSTVSEHQPAGGSGSSAVLGTAAVAQFTASLVQQQNPEFAFPLGDLHADVPAYVPAQRCLDMLHNLAVHNPRASMHFLVEHPQTAKAAAKGDEESRFPLVNLLLLLEKPLFYSHGNTVTELLMQLLATITKPLGSMVKRQQQQQQQQQQDESQEGGSKKPACLPLPVIPAHALRAIVNVLAAGECTSRTFQHTLSLIQNLSHMHGVLSEVIGELVTRASSLSSSVCEDIGQLLPLLQSLTPPDEADDQENESTSNTPARTRTPTEMAAELLDSVRDITLARFSPASSHQSRLLRLLMALDYISTTLSKRLEGSSGTPAKPADEAAAAAAAASGSEAMDVDSKLAKTKQWALIRGPSFQPLWAATSECLKCTASSADLAHVATVLLPLIESFMVVFKPIVGEKPAAAPSSASTSDVAASNADDAGFQAFTEQHKKILNTLVRSNPGLLSGSFSLLVYNPHVLDFDNKRSYFYQRLHDDSPSNPAARRNTNSRPLPAAALNLNVRRNTVFEDSFHQFAGKSGDEIKRGRLHVKFHDEEGVDAGGVSREWFQALARQMFNPNYALFKPSASGRVTYQPNAQSWANPEHLLYFKFVGRIIGKAIVDQRVLDAYFTRSFYKHILGRKVDYRDMEAIDLSYYKSLEWILENDITDVVEETFSMEVDNFGQREIIDLIPDGQNVLVTESNKAEYVRLVTEQRLSRAIKDQIAAFLNGFHDLIPQDLIQIFNEQELELLISGMPDIDVDDWRNNTDYHGGYSASSAQIQWFWRAVRSFDQEERAKLLQFVTGTSKVPLEGFAHLQGSQGVQKFQIHKDFGSPKRLPTAHTCFNQLDLPLCENFETLKANLLMAISECSTGFGFV